MKKYYCEAQKKQLEKPTEPKELPPPDFYPMMRQLYYCGNNLNQIAKKAHTLNVIDVQHYDEVVNLFRQTVQEISNAVISPQ